MKHNTFIFTGILMVLLGLAGLVFGQNMVDAINCRAGDMSPMRAASYYNQMGITAMESDVMDTAERYFDCAIYNNAEYYVPYYNRGKLAFTQTNYDAALIDFHQVLKTAPQPRPEYYLYIAMSYDHLADSGNALSNYQLYSDLAQYPEVAVVSRMEVLQSNVEYQS